MFGPQAKSYLLAAALLLSVAWGHKQQRRSGHTHNQLVVASEKAAITNGQSISTSTAAVAALLTVSVNDLLLSSNTTSASAASVAADSITAETINSTALVIARDITSAYSAYSGLNDHGIPYSVLIVPQNGTTLPSLNDTATTGNYGLIVVLSEVSYDYGGTEGYQSALTTDQWTALFNYQVSFGVRMVRLDVYPSSDTGTTSLGGCCDTDVEQYISISNDTAFTTAGLRVGATLSSVGLWHYPASITNSSIATEFAQFATTDGFSNVSTAAVINNISGRQQMVFFTSFATDWSLTSNFLQHAWINWATRGLYVGYRRALLPTQIDDMFLESDIYSPNGTTYRIGTADLANHITFMKTINAKLNTGSDWWIEIGHNGNGNIEESDDLDTTGELCSPGPIEYGDQVDTALEFMKPLGTGTSIWPDTPVLYPNYTAKCLQKDKLLVWWQTASNRDAFSHVSHTFTHEDQDNATYSDCYKELSWNQAWLNASGIASAKKFSGTGLIPPAITGLHNGDALRAWKDCNITHVVGDNTRPVLLNTVNEHWPLISTVEENGFDGIQITPRWATNVYYNCDLPDCTVLEWINTSAGAGNITDLLEIEKTTNVRHLLGLHHDAYMFHQANLRYTGAATYTINGVTAQLSLFQAWVETVTQEFVRLVNWPVLTYKHDDLAALFMARMTRDQCFPSLSYNLDTKTETITTITVSASGNTCSEPVPVTFPNNVTSMQGFTKEQVGDDPLTLWVTLSGTPVTFTLSTPIPV